MRNSNIRHVENYDSNNKNILYSLNYLMEEAKRTGNQELYKIIEVAYLLGQRAITNMDDSDFKEEYDEDTLEAAAFLFQYVHASVDVKKDVLALLEEEEKKHNRQMH